MYVFWHDLLHFSYFHQNEMFYTFPLRYFNFLVLVLMSRILKADFLLESIVLDVYAIPTWIRILISEIEKLE